MLLSTTWSGKSTNHHHLFGETCPHTAVTNNGRRIPTDRNGESHLTYVCVWVSVCLCVQAHVNVLLSLIIMFIHHNKPMNNSTLQNKGTTLCMLKNKRPYKWWMIGNQNGYYTVSNSHSFSHVTLSIHACMWFYCMWKNYRKKPLDPHK